MFIASAPEWFSFHFYFIASSCQSVNSYPPESNIQLYRILPPQKGIISWFCNLFSI